MIALDRSAWICDMAETYGIYDYRSLPLHTVATLSAGLREGSRIKMKIRGDKGPHNRLLLAMVSDQLTGIMAAFGVYKDKEIPVMLTDLIEGIESNASGSVQSFRTGEEFEARKRAILGGE